MFARTVAALLLVATVASVACRSNSGDKTTSTPTSEFTSAAEEAARETVLALSDAPAGWTSEPDEPADDMEEQFDVTAECAYINEITEGFPGQTAFANGEALIPPSTGPEINSEASVFHEVDAAKGALDDYRSFHQDCRDEYLGVVETQAAEGGSFNNVEITDLDLQSTGDDAFGIRLDASAGDGGGVVIDFVTVRHGRVLATLIVGGSQPYDDQRTAFLEVLDDRAAAANEGLPPP